jgi:hypothetical protein
MELRQYNYKEEYKKGKTHKNADAVSKRPHISENSIPFVTKKYPCTEQEADVEPEAIIKSFNEGETAQSLQLLDKIEPQYKKISSALLLKDGVLCKIRNKIIIK